MFIEWEREQKQWAKVYEILKCGSYFHLRPIIGLRGLIRLVLERVFLSFPQILNPNAISFWLVTCFILDLSYMPYIILILSHLAPFLNCSQHPPLKAKLGCWVFFTKDYYFYHRSSDKACRFILWSSSLHKAQVCYSILGLRFMYVVEFLKVNLII